MLKVMEEASDMKRNRRMAQKRGLLPPQRNPSSLSFYHLDSKDPFLSAASW